MGQPAAVIGNNHTCPKVDGVVPHVGGPISSGASKVTIKGKPAARKGDQCVCATGGPDIIKEGSGKVMIEGMSAARLGDPTEHGGVIAEGESSVLIG